MEDEQIEIRIGDRERRSVDARLRVALDDGVLTLTEYDERTAKAWGARTRAELEVLTRDLPEPVSAADGQGEPAAAPRPAEQTAPAKCDDDEDEKPGIVSRMIGGLVTGALVVVGGFLGWQVLSSEDGAAVFGRQTVHVGEGQESVEVGALFGRVEIVVPEGMRANPSGTLIFGRTDCEQACAGDAEAEAVVVDVTGGFARVDILTPQEFTQDDRDDD